MAHRCCPNGSCEQVLIVHVEGSGGHGEDYKAYAREHYNNPGEFYWGQLTFSCHCDRTIEVEPTPTDAPTIAPTAMASSSPGPSKCVASNADSGRECRPLVGQDGTEFGQVCMEVVDDGSDPNHKVHVTYEVKGDFRMTRKYLWLGDSSNAQVPVLTGEQDALEPDLDAFPHYSW
jgi:hypothetical protein